jgi:8-oxo-dGTP diphosphatase
MNQSHTILTVDAIVIRNSKVLMITRGRGAHIGKLAFPGGKVDFNEDPEVACIRELSEETGILGTEVKLLKVLGKPGRDPRGHYVSIVY